MYTTRSYSAAYTNATSGWFASREYAPCAIATHLPLQADEYGHKTWFYRFSVCIFDLKLCWARRYCSWAFASYWRRSPSLFKMKHPQVLSLPSTILLRSTSRQEGVPSSRATTRSPSQARLWTTVGLLKATSNMAKQHTPGEIVRREVWPTSLICHIEAWEVRYFTLPVRPLTPNLATQRLMLA